MLIIENGKVRIAYLMMYRAEKIIEDCKYMQEAHTCKGGLETHKHVSECEAEGENLQSCC